MELLNERARKVKVIFPYKKKKKEEEEEEEREQPLPSIGTECQPFP